MLAPHLALSEPVTPTDLVARVRAARRAADTAELDVFRLGLAWADAHPAVPGHEVWHAAKTARARNRPWVESPDPDDVGDPRSIRDLEDLEWFGIPALAWDAPASFAAANAMSTGAGKTYLRDALILRHRLPQLHARVISGAVPVWRARRVAAAVLGQPHDVVDRVDTEVAPLAESIGPIVLTKLVDRILIDLHAEALELESYLALDDRHATLHEESVGHTGIAEMTIRADLPDLKDFDRALSDIAAALLRSDAATRGDTDAVEPLDVRRARAVGILADPAAALALLDTDPTWASKATRRRVDVIVHPEAALHGSAATTHPAQHTAPGPFGQPFLTDTVLAWCARPGTRVTVRPVIDLAEQITTDTYRPTTTQTTLVTLRDRTCVFPRCTRPAVGCDNDHVIAYQHLPDPHTDADTGDPPGGQTNTHQLAPTCRHHHRLKTHGGWRTTAIAPGTYLWRDPHHQVFLRTPDGATHDLTDRLDHPDGRSTTTGEAA